MNISVKSSLCAPKRCPPHLRLDPTAVTVTASGTPHVRISPIKAEFPNITGTMPVVTTTLPKPEAEASLYTIPWIEAPLPLPGVEDIAEMVKNIALPDDADSDAFPMDHATRKVPAARRDNDDDALRYNSLGVAVCFEMRADLGEFTIDFGSFNLDMGTFRLHGERENTKANILPLQATLDLDKTTLRAKLDAVDVELTGCLVLNGADSCCDEPAKPTPPKSPRTRKAKA